MTQPALLIGLDVGQVRTGLARASTAARLAEPLQVVPTEQVMTMLKKLAAEHDIEAVIIGRPRNLAGAETAQTESVKDWVAELKKQLSLPLFWQDETLSSQTAEQTTTSHKKHLDAEAAAVILQDWLDSPESERVAC